MDKNTIDTTKWIKTQWIKHNRQNTMDKMTMDKTQQIEHNI